MVKFRNPSSVTNYFPRILKESIISRRGNDCKNISWKASIHFTSLKAQITSFSTQPEKDFGKPRRRQNLIERIVQNYVARPEGSNVEKVYSGDIVFIEPKYMMTHDNTMAVMKKFQQLGIKKVKNPRQLVFTLDHNVQDKSMTNLKKYEAIQTFAKEQNIDFFPAGRGIGHQVLMEEGYILPGSLVVASDSHSNMYGAIGCLGTPVVRTDACAIWATGMTWWKIPEVVQICFYEKLPLHVTAKDLILTLIKEFTKKNLQHLILNKAIEFTGPGVVSLSIDERMTISNMTTEWGACAGVFPADQLTLEWIQYQMGKYYHDPQHRWFTEFDVELHGSNRDLDYHKGLNLHSTTEGSFKANIEAEFLNVETSPYSACIDVDLSKVKQCVSGPDHVALGQPINEIEEQKLDIQKAYIVSCVNSRVSDLKEAAKVFQSTSKKVHPNVELYIAAASANVEKISKQRGDWDILINAGAKPLPSGCGPCVGLGAGLLKKGERGVSATNRNFKGRMGSRDAEVYLASPEIVAASAISGYITSPQSLLEPKISAEINTHIDKQSHQKSNIVEKVLVYDKNSQYTEESLQIQKSEDITNPQYSPSERKEKSQNILNASSLLFLPSDNINTDGIFGGLHTYKSNLNREELASFAFENYDPDFTSTLKNVVDCFLLVGKNFGCGSSREQAATCILANDIKVVIAASVNETFLRNSVNNGLYTIVCPDLYDHFFQTNKNLDGSIVERTTILNEVQNIDIDLETKMISIQLKKNHSSGESIAETQKSLNFVFLPIGEVAKEVIQKGGIENWALSKFSDHQDNLEASSYE